MTDHRPQLIYLGCCRESLPPTVEDEDITFIIAAVWHAGKQLCIPDFLSSAPINRPTPEDETDYDEAAAYVRHYL